MEKLSYVYIMTNKINGTLYIGVTADLIKRVWQHRNKLILGFTEKYCVKHLVYYEQQTDISEAIRREKQLKKWSRTWKLKLINDYNPTWKDLYYSLS